MNVQTSSAEQDWKILCSTHDYDRITHQSVQWIQLFIPTTMYLLLLCHIFLGKIHGPLFKLRRLSINKQLQIRHLQQHRVPIIANIKFCQFLKINTLQPVLNTCLTYNYLAPLPQNHPTPHTPPMSGWLDGFLNKDQYRNVSLNRANVHICSHVRK